MVAACSVNQLRRPVGRRQRVVGPPQSFLKSLANAGGLRYDSNSNQVRLCFVELIAAIGGAVGSVSIACAAPVDVLGGPVTNAGNRHVYYILTRTNWTASHQHSDNTATLDSSVFLISYCNNFRSSFVVCVER